MMQEDIQFLKELQQELLTQEHDSQAAPRFWSIMDYRTVPTHEEYGMERMMYYHNDGDHTEFDTVEELKDFLWDYYFDEDTDELGDVLKQESISFHDLWEYVLEDLNEDGHFGEVPVKEESFIVPNTMFLTKDEARSHLKANHYHYTSKAHTYAMTAWRAPKIERLIKILETFDWNKIEEIAEEKSFFLKAYVEKVMNE